MKTLNPEWGEVFTFRTPPGKDELDDEDEVELIVYDRDFALHDFIGYTKVDLSGTQAGQILFTTSRVFRSTLCSTEGNTRFFIGGGRIKTDELRLKNFGVHRKGPLGPR